MASKCLLIISSGLENKEKAIVGFRYAMNVKKNSLLDDIKVILFGPSEKALASGDIDFVKFIRRLIELKVIPVACSGVAINENISSDLEKNGLLIDDVGPIISKYIKEGYAVITF